MSDTLNIKQGQKLPKKDLDEANHHYRIGKQHYQDGRFREAIDELSIVLKYKPDAAECVSLIGAAALELGDPVLSLKLNIRALELNPFSQMVINNCGKYWEVTGEWENAVKFYLAALQKEPDNVVLLNNCGLALLRSGNLKQGWKMWEQRHEVARKLGSRLARLKPRYFNQPLWDGSHLVGKKLFIWAEQGVGDEMMYGTMLQDLKPFGGDITVESDPRLIDLFRRSFPFLKFVPSPYKKAELGIEHYHYQCSLASLGRIVRDEISKFPKSCNMLLPQEEAVEKWRKRFAEISDRPKIGLSWRSMRRSYDRDMHYAQVKDLAPLMNIPDVDFINMQYTCTQEEINEFEELYGRPLHTWDDIDLKDDLDELAAYAKNLDMNISPSSTPCAFTGAQNIPTCVFINTDKRNINTLGQDRYMWFPIIDMYYKSKDETDANWQKTFEKMANDITEFLKDSKT